MVETRYAICAAVAAKKNSANAKHRLVEQQIPEAQAVAVAEHLAEGCSIKGTARLVRVDDGTVRRLNSKMGRHGRQYHEQKVQDVSVTELQADERYGFAGSKA